MTSSYPPIPLKIVKPFPCRPLLPILPPNDPLNYPSLPSKLRKPRFNESFNLSTHIFPAAYLRRGPDLPIPRIPPFNARKRERDNAVKFVYGTFQENWNSSSVKNGKHEKVLWNVVNRYVRNDLDKSTSTGITLFFAHANGHTKEIWEPVLARVLSSPLAHMIDEVWTWESIQHGDAGLINSDHLPAFFDWSDNARDINNFFLHFLPSNALGKSLPVHLPRVSVQEVEKRLRSGFENRTLITIGHSFGGTSIALGAVSHPELFSAVILIDPVMINPKEPPVLDWALKGAMKTLVRKDTWESKEQAYVEFSSSPYYKSWDLDVLKVYVDSALYETTVTTATGVTKTTAKTKITPFHEALVFFGGDVPTEAFVSLRNLSESVRLHWIVSGAQGAPQFGPPGSQHERVWLRPKNSSNTIIKKAGHLIPQEAPAEVAQEIFQFLERYYHQTRCQTLRSNL
ncbi:hypothetical protein AGABI2DRAFT_180214 [Agaricus bisporus var. bisporus H97]|uniref:hypothetical protein n=1 Tax=Agaricus bisporus var. bisporus (strain H97 / ATCC MYA-4626 / FGSC 10389) TaxID=936046 RepID=UPI00029F7785|nr:hypothetical protein AGABI2DRAFT_180214 [Agaricus bisporus var. bisporus H97]EKV44833.1 hypothetical protein AGABI2DRAFT_180214 [Agaricus bisporus var. bisporus H97]